MLTYNPTKTTISINQAVVALRSLCAYVEFNGQPGVIGETTASPASLVTIVTNMDDQYDSVVLRMNLINGGEVVTLDVVHEDPLRALEVNEQLADHSVACMKNALECEKNVDVSDVLCKHSFVEA